MNEHLEELRLASLSAVAGDVHGARYASELHQADAAYIEALEAEVRRLTPPNVFVRCPFCSAILPPMSRIGRGREESDG